MNPVAVLLSKAESIAFNIQSEENTLVRFISALGGPENRKALDVGCGFGKKIALLQSCGWKTVGVDVNPEIIRINSAAGIECMTVDAFNASDDCYDLILMSHVIEHFLPDALLQFMDSYLDRLKTGGHLVLVTPLASPYFFDDFDHVKPYHPTGINMVFGGGAAQVQYYSKNKIQAVDIWFRRGPFRMMFHAGLHVKRRALLFRITNVMLALLFRGSFGLIGRTDGWVGLYQKVKRPE
jgi:SAM-dependent methyltransferase